MVKVLKNDLDLEATLFSGQCFRAIKENNKYIIILNDRVVELSIKDNFIFAESNNEVNLEKKLIEYFDLKRDYNFINEFLIKQDINMKEFTAKCKGYKILKQDTFETFISFIISQNNNVKRISTIVNRLSKKYGEKVIFKNKEYYLFPSANKLINLTEKELIEFNLGYRAKYITNALKEIKEDNTYLDKINKLNTEEALKELMKINGIGMKVASCILLFGFYRFDAFPIDTWVKKRISKYYNVKNNLKSIKKFAYNTYKNYSGLAIQYMYHSERNVDNKKLI